MMAPAISIGIFHALAKREGCEFKIFETTEYSNAYSNRHIRMTEIGANGPNKKHMEVMAELFKGYTYHWRSSQEPARKGYAGTMFLYKEKYNY